MSRAPQFDLAFANPRRGREGVFGAALVLLFLAACTRDPPANAVGKARAELGIEATQPRQAWFPAQDFPVQQFGGAVVAQGDSFTGFWPGTRNPGPRGFFFTTLFADGGLAPVGFATPNDFEQAQLTITPLDDSRSVLTSSWGEHIVLGLVDARGLIGSTVMVRAAQPFRVVSHRGALPRMVCVLQPSRPSAAATRVMSVMSLSAVMRSRWPARPTGSSTQGRCAEQRNHSATSTPAAMARRSVVPFLHEMRERPATTARSARPTTSAPASRETASAGVRRERGRVTMATSVRQETSVSPASASGASGVFLLNVRSQWPAERQGVSSHQRSMVFRAMEGRVQPARASA